MAILTFRMEFFLGFRNSHLGRTGLSVPDSDYGMASPLAQRGKHTTRRTKRSARNRAQLSDCSSFRVAAAYFCAGGVAGAGFWAGACVVAGVLVNTEPLSPALRVAMIASVKEVTMKMIAAHVVALVRALAAERGPKAVWLPCPPKAAAISALLPLCSSTTAIRNRQTTTCMTVTNATMLFLSSLPGLHGGDPACAALGLPSRGLKSLLRSRLSSVQ